MEVNIERTLTKSHHNLKPANYSFDYVILDYFNNDKHLPTASL